MGQRGKSQPADLANRRAGHARAESESVHQAAHFLIGGNQSFGVRLTERDMQRPLVTVQLPKTVRSEAAAFGTADSGGANEQERVGVAGRRLRRSSCCNRWSSSG